MIVDDLTCLARYEAVVPHLRRVRDFLAATPLATLPCGRLDIDGARLYVLVADGEGRGQAAAALEAHRRYVDVQIPIVGTDVIGWRPLVDCHQIATPYDAIKDIVFFQDLSEAWLSIASGRMAIFFPDDAHAPLAGAGPLRKAVFKIAL